MTFHVGQKVVCIDDTGWVNPGNEEGRKYGPHKGEIYTVSGFFHDLLTLVECDKFESVLPLAYRPSRFRPVEYKAMEIFRRIAANPNIEIKEDA